MWHAKSIKISIQTTNKKQKTYVQREFGEIVYNGALFFFWTELRPVSPEGPLVCRQTQAMAAWTWLYVDFS